MMTLPPLTIRQATESDYEQLCDLFEELDALHRQARPDLFQKPEGPPRERAYVAALIAGPLSAILVASDRQSRHLLGFATLIARDIAASPVRPERRILEIDNFGVRKEARRKGVGQALVNHALQWGNRRGFAEVELAVHEFNADAIGFYERMGFSTSLRRMALACPV
jgi:ribosomal protein S18 acetylase RimI-like enzyme